MERWWKHLPTFNPPACARVSGSWMCSFETTAAYEAWQSSIFFPPARSALHRGKWNIQSNMRHDGLKLISHQPRTLSTRIKFHRRIQLTLLAYKSFSVEPTCIYVSKYCDASLFSWIHIYTFFAHRLWLCRRLLLPFIFVIAFIINGSVGAAVCWCLRPSIIFFSRKLKALPIGCAERAKNAKGKNRRQEKNIFERWKEISHSIISSKNFGDTQSRACGNEKINLIKD